MKLKYYCVMLSKEVLLLVEETGQSSVYMA